MSISKQKSSKRMFAFFPHAATCAVTTPGGLEKRGRWVATATGQTGHAMQICSTTSKWGYLKMGYTPQIVIWMEKIMTNWLNKTTTAEINMFFPQKNQTNLTKYQDRPIFLFVLALCRSEALGLPDWLPEVSDIRRRSVHPVSALL